MFFLLAISDACVECAEDASSWLVTMANDFGNHIVKPQWKIGVFLPSLVIVCLYARGAHFLTRANYLRYGRLREKPRYSVGRYLRPIVYVVGLGVWYVSWFVALFRLFFLQLKIGWHHRRRLNCEDVQRLAEFDLLQPPPDQHDAYDFWKSQRSVVVLERQPYEFSTCFDLHQVLTKSAALHEYSKWILQEYSVAVPDASRFSGSIVCRVTIKDGFFAPLYLLAGLLARCDDEWPPVVRKYGTTRAEEPETKSNDDGDITEFSSTSSSVG